MDNIVSENMKMLRLLFGYTTDEVAGILELAPQDYARYESGELEVPYQALEKVSDLYGCDVTLLFEECDNIESKLLLPKFRVGRANIVDEREIMNFKSIVKSYMAMESQMV